MLQTQAWLETDVQDIRAKLPAITLILDLPMQFGAGEVRLFKAVACLALQLDPICVSLVFAQHIEFWAALQLCVLLTHSWV